MKYCIKCGFKNKDEAKFCKNCGENLIKTYHGEKKINTEAIISDTEYKHVTESLKEVTEKGENPQRKALNMNNVAVEDVVSKKNNFQKENRKSRTDTVEKANYKIIEIIGFILAILAVFIMPVICGIVSLCIGILMLKKNRRFGIVIIALAIVCSIVGTILGVLTVG